MDGTLLDENGKLPVEFADLMAKLKARNVAFCPASGRQYYSLADSFAEYADQFIFLSDNGTMVRQHGQEIFSNVMDKKTAIDLLNSVNDIAGIYNVYCGKKKAYLLKAKNPQKYMDELGKYFRTIELVDDFAAVDDEPIKTSFFTAQGDADTKIYPLFKAQEKSMQVVLASAYWVDITNKGANKGLTVKEIQRRLNIRPDECAAFGDYMNDKEMLEAVYYSYAMANAYPAIKAIARFEAPSNTEHGVIKQIEKLIAEGLC